METKQIALDDGSGDRILLTYQGHGDGTISFVITSNTSWTVE